MCALVIDTGGLTCQQLLGIEPIVSTPLVFPEHDIVVMGDKSGRLWAIKGLSSGDSLHFPVPITIGGSATWITSSPTPLTNEGAMEFIFSAYVPGGGQALVGRARVEVTPDGKPRLVVPQGTTFDSGAPTDGRLWIKRLANGEGMADGFAVIGSQGYAFVNDLKGQLFRLDLESGSLPSIKAPGDGSVSLPRPGVRFANDLAAVAADGGTAYFSMRNYGTATSDYVTPGSVVRIDVADWDRSKKDQQPQEKRLPEDAWAINTPPLLWDDRVIVATTRGHVYALNRHTLQPAEFVHSSLPAGYRNSPTGDGSSMWLLKHNEGPFMAKHSYQPLSGAGVQPIVASGGTGQTYLIMGVNYCEGGNPDVPTGCDPANAKGRLVAFRALTDDPYVARVACPRSAIDWFDFVANVGFTSTAKKPLTQSVLLRLQRSGQTERVERVSVTLQPGGKQLISRTVTDLAPGTYTLTASWDLPGTYRDKNWNNNVASCQVTVEACEFCDVPPPPEGGSVLLGDS